LIRRCEVLVLREVPKEEIKKLRAGDFFMDEEIINIQRKHNLISIVTKTGNVFNAHEKQYGFNVFKKQSCQRETGRDVP
jgi:hypothetical protein